MAQAFRTQNLRLLASILDANDNELIKSPSPVASAVNELTISNAATSVPPSISATGDDANIGLNLISKGTGLIQINGKAISLANSFTTIGNFSLAFTTTGNTSLTLPTSGTLATTSQIPTVYDNTLTLAGSGGVSVSATPTFTANASADKTITITIADAALTLAKLANIGASTILGNNSPSSAGAPAALSVATVASMLSNQTMNIVGTATSVTDIVLVAKGGTGVATANANAIFVGPSSGSAAAPSFRAMVSADIPTGIVTYAKIQYVANTARVLGRISSLSGEIEELNGANIVTVIDTNAVARATNLAGGIAGQIPYQSGANTTAFSAAGSSNQVLLSGAAGAPTWASQSTLSVGSATTAGSVTNALTISSPLTGTSYNGSTAISIGLQNASDTLAGGVSIGAQTFAGNKTFKDAVIISGDLTVNGTTITINSSTLSVDDKNIELGAVIAIASLSSTSNITATSNIVDVTSTSGLIVGQALTKTSGTGAFGASPIIDSIVSATQFTVAPVHATTGSIVFSVSGATDITADTGGITLKGTTNKTFNWLNATSSWTSSENLDIVTGKTYKINNVAVLSATTLGSSVVNSSLTSVGTLANLTVTNTITGSVSGSAASLSNIRTFWGQDFNGTQNVSGNLTSVGNITGTSGITITAGGSNQNVVLTPTGTGYTLLNGNVGIGQISPLEKLQVQGNIYATDGALFNFKAQRIPLQGSPQQGTYKGYLILAKAYTSGNVAASYVIGKVILRRGNSGTGHNLDIYEVNSSRGYDNEIFQVSRLGTIGTRFLRLVKVTYGGVIYHAIETSNDGGQPSTEMYFEGSIIDSPLILTDETFVSDVSAFGNAVIFVDESSNVGIGIITPAAVLNVKTSTTANREVFMGDSTAVVGVFRARLDDNSLSFISIENRDTNTVADHGVGIRFNLGTNASNNAINAGGIYLGKEQTWTATASTQDSYLTFNTSLDGAAVEKVRIKSDGNVGIGTITPIFKFQVVGSAYVNNGTLYIDSGNTLTWGNSTQSILGVNNVGLSFIAGSATRMFVSSGGNVGIGTVTPVAKLHINSTTAGETVLRSDGTNGTLFSVVDDLSDSLMSVNNSAGLPVLEVFADDRIVAGQYGQNDLVVVNNKVGLGANSPINKLSVIGSASIGDSTYNVSAPTNGLIIQGDVGIGTATPTAQANYRFLQVNGPVSAIIETTVNGTRIGGFDSTSNTLFVGTIGAFPIVFRTGVNEKWRITNAGVLQSSTAQTIQTATGILTLATLAGDGHIVLSPHGTGNVGIGDTTTTAKLDVNGTVRVRSISASGSAGTIFLTTNATGILVSRTAAEVRSDIGAGTGNGTVTGVTGTAPIASTGGTAPVISLSGIVPIANGGTGVATAQLAINALAGAVTTAQFLRGNGTNILMSAIQVADVPTLNQSTSGTAAGLSAVLAIASGGTGTASAAINTIFAGPSSGSAGAPSFRAMGSADIPAGIVTLAKIQNIAVSTVLGNSSSSDAQAPLEINMTTLAAMLSGKTMDILGNATNVTGTVLVANGGTGTATAVINTIFAGPSSGSTGAPTFRAIVSADIPSSITLTTPVIGNIKMGYTTTATAAGTTALTVSSNHYQRFTGSTTQTITLPVTSTLVAGMSYVIENNSTGLLTVNSSGGNLVITVIPGVTVNCLCVGITLTTAADWDVEYDEFASITGTGSVVLSLSPTLVTPTLGVPASGDLSNCTGTAVGLTANTVTTNANLTGPVTSSGNGTAITNSAVTYAKIQNVNPDRVLGRTTGSAAGIVEELSGANIATIIGSSPITNASNVTIATDDSTASSYYLYFGANIDGNNPLKASTKIRYNPSTGAFSATTKSFRIPHPTKLEHDLVYGSLESPYHGVRLTGKGKTKGNRAEIFLPDYIKSLIDEETVNIQLTAIKCAKILYIENIIIDDNKFTVKYDKSWHEKSKDIEFYWDFTAERKDVPKLIVEEKI